VSVLGWVAVLSLLAAVGTALGPAFVAVRRTPLDVASRAGWVNRLLQLAEDATAAEQASVASAARALIDALVEGPKPAGKGK
jgi:hypothetical protein